MAKCNNATCRTHLNTAPEDRWLHTGFCSTDCRNEHFQGVFPKVTLLGMDLPDLDNLEEGVSYRSQIHGSYITGASRALEQARTAEEKFPNDVTVAIRNDKVPRFLAEDPEGFLFDYYFSITSAVDACLKFAEGELNRVLHDLEQDEGISDNFDDERTSNFRRELENFQLKNLEGFRALERLPPREKAQKILEFLDLEKLDQGNQVWQNFGLAKAFRDELEHAKTQSWVENPDSDGRTNRSLVDKLKRQKPSENPVLHSDLIGYVIHDDMPVLQRFISSEYGEWVHDSCFLFLRAFFNRADLLQFGEH